MECYRVCLPFGEVVIVGAFAVMVVTVETKQTTLTAKTLENCILVMMNWMNVMQCIKAQSKKMLWLFEEQSGVSKEVLLKKEKVLGEKAGR